MASVRRLTSAWTGRLTAVLTSLPLRCGSVNRQSYSGVRRLLNLVLIGSALVTVLTNAYGTRIETTCGDKPVIEYTHSPTPIKRVKPIYPRRAIVREIGGYVELEVGISEEGIPVNLEIVSSSPQMMFDRSAQSAVSKWRFELGASQAKVRISYRTDGTTTCYIEDA